MEDIKPNDDFTFPVILPNKLFAALLGVSYFIYSCCTDTFLKDGREKVRILCKLSCSNANNQIYL